MNKSRLALSALSLSLTLALAACSGGSGGSSGSMSISSCSLGCASSGGSGQVSCGITNVFVNQEIRIAFGRPVDLTTVNNNTFQVVEISSGKTPPGSFSIDPNDDKVLIYRPLLTFDSSGNPVFGLTDGETYQVKLPGTVLDPIGPYIQSTGGQNNVNRMQCSIVASEGVFDPKPGQATMQIFVDVADVSTYDGTFYPSLCGAPPCLFEDQEATGTILSDVFRDTQITIFFDDLMNPGTLVNPVTGTSDLIEVIVDPDGDITDPTDQSPIDGTYTINIDQDALVTTVVFTPESSLPSAGTDVVNPRKIIVRVPAQVLDLGGLPISNSGDTVFIPEAVPFPEQTIVEGFSTSANEDTERTGNTWVSPNGLVKGPGGGSGRHGDLSIPAGTTVTLNTDSEDFSSISDPAIYDPTTTVDMTVPGVVDPITDGVFEFSTLLVETGGTLKFTGSKPPRVYVRGEMLIQGILSVAGATPVDHISILFDGGAGGAGGPGGGNGGPGGDLPDVGSGSDLLFAGGIDNPNNPVYYTDLDGKPGEGIPFPDTISPTSTVAEGDGGLAWPQPHPSFPGGFMPDDRGDILGMQLDPGALCKETTPGGPGAGGAYALDGTSGIATEAFGSQSDILPPNATPGASAEVGIDAVVRSLDPDLGLLRGGAGGGGGGAGIIDTQTDGKAIFGPCTLTTTGFPAVVVAYKQASGAGGGGAGGGLQAQAGRKLTVNGVIDASGGDGGSRDNTAGSSVNKAQAGGGGAGGGVLLQSPQVLLSAVPGRVDISGGSGGTGNPAGSVGGSGGAGLLRMETFTPLPTITTESTKIFPDPVQLAVLGATPSDILDIQAWDPAAPTSTVPNTMSGAQSCWLQPTGNFFLLSFVPDDGMAGTLGWDLSLKIFGVTNPQSYRGNNEITGGSLQGLLGNTLGASALIVRFQGARSLTTIEDLCDVELYGPESDIFPGSLTPWVTDPVMLNDYYGDPTLRPNMIRFSVIWDSSQIFYNNIEGITDLSITVQPD
jgi:hypothetical protein